MSRPNKVGIKCSPSVRPSVHKSFFDLIEIWYVGRGRWLMHDSMLYEPIQGQGHEPLKVGIPSISKLGRLFTTDVSAKFKVTLHKN